MFLFLHTDDFWRDYHLYVARGVTFVRPPSQESFGTVAVFRDLYGNLWDLVQPAQDHSCHPATHLKGRRMSVVHAPHDIAFRHRRTLLGLGLAGAVVCATLDPASAPADRPADVLSVVLVAGLGYVAMRVLSWLLVRLLSGRAPRLLRGWGLFWFYGALPLLLLALYAGSAWLDAPRPGIATLGFVVAAAASIAAGAFAAVRDTQGEGPVGASSPGAGAVP